MQGAYGTQGELIPYFMVSKGVFREVYRGAHTWKFFEDSPVSTAFICKSIVLEGLEGVIGSHLHTLDYLEANRECRCSIPARILKTANQFVIPMPILIAPLIPWVWRLETNIDIVTPIRLHLIGLTTRTI